MTDLRLDFDGDIPTDFEYRLRFFGQRMRWYHGDVRYDRTAHGWHVVVPVQLLDGTALELPFPIVVAAQAILGSDWKREAFNLARAAQIEDVPDFWRQRANTLYAEHTRGSL
jgi:hypothetical protein